MTELKKVTDETDAAYTNFLSGAGQSAKELGASISDIVNSTADFARLGYSLSDATELAKVATVYTHVGDDLSGIGEATGSIISTMKAFNIEAKDSISIVDKFNGVSNNFAISAGGLGQALQRSASALHTAGNTLSESIGMIVAANDVAQDEESVGNALKVLSLRIRGAKTELKEMGVWIFGTAAEGSIPMYQANLTVPAAIVIGNEGDGMSQLVRKNCDVMLNIPMKGHISSLNASAAASILLYEALRQRLG